MESRNRRASKKSSSDLSKAAASAFALLIENSKQHGPYRVEWPDSTKMPKDQYHCHLKKGNPPMLLVGDYLRNYIT